MNKIPQSEFEEQVRRAQTRMEAEKLDVLFVYG